MNISNGGLSPISLESIERIDKYKSSIIESESLSRNNPGKLPVLPISHTPVNINSRFPNRGTSNVNRNPGYPSPPSSIARSSGGAGFYPPSESGIGRNDDRFEKSLLHHYSSLKKYLLTSQADEKTSPRPNRARDKLLRLSPTQFQELSTDVYDELIRRQDDGRRPAPNGVPVSYLLPRDTFHPKRNQARKKLSTLPISRFKDLATDVFYELERRLPTFAGDDIVRVRTPSTSIGGPPTRINLPMSEKPKRPPSETSTSNYSPTSHSRNSSMPLNNQNISSPEPTVNDFDRPTLKSVLSNTIIPNKSTIVEDDETEGEDGDADAFGLEGAANSKSSSVAGSESLIGSYGQNMKASQGLFNRMDENLKQNNDELCSVIKSQVDQIAQLDTEKKALQELTLQLETKLADSLSLNESLKVEINRIKETQVNEANDLPTPANNLKLTLANLKVSNNTSELQQENEMLRESLIDQKRIAEDVRLKTQEALREMRTLSEKSQLSSEKEEHLLITIQKLEAEIKEWRARYVNTKTQLRSLRVNSIDCNLQLDSSNIATYRDFIDANGMAKDFNVIKFQISVNDLLKQSRHQDLEQVMESMKSVVLNTRNILQDISETASSGNELTPLQKKVKLSVTIAAKNLITASKNFVIARGLSPVSLLDAAISHLTSAVIQLLRAVKIHPTPNANFEDIENIKTLDGPESTSEYSPVNYIDPENLDSSAKNNDQIQSRSSRNSILSNNSSIYSSINSSIKSRHVSEIEGNPNMAPIPPPKGTALGNRTKKSDIEKLKLYLENQTILLVQEVQSLVSNIRSESDIMVTLNSINAISDVIKKVVHCTGDTISIAENNELRIRGDSVIKNLSTVRKRLMEAGMSGQKIADEAKNDDESGRAWKAWNQILPPIAFEIAREMKELSLQLDALQISNVNQQNSAGGEEDDFS